MPQSQTLRGRRRSVPRNKINRQTIRWPPYKSDVDRLNQRLAQSEINASLQKQKSDELAGKLDATEADLQQERDLRSAKSEMGDLVAARSLHIVDVYDADTRTESGSGPSDGSSTSRASHSYFTRMIWMIRASLEGTWSSMCGAAKPESR